MIHYAIKLNTNVKTVGYVKDAEAKKASNTAASHALKKVLGIKKTTSGTEIIRIFDEGRKYPAFDDAPKPYGMHEGTQHAALLATGTVSADSYEEVAVKLDNAISELSNVEKFAFEQNVSNYQQARSKTVAEMVQLGHSVMNPEEHAFYREALKKYSFKYCNNQITIILWSPANFHEDCMYDEKRQLFVYIIKGKTVYTRDFITSTELMKLRNAVNLKTRKDTSLMTRTNMIIGKAQRSSTGLLKVVAIHTNSEQISNIKANLNSPLRWSDIDQVDHIQ